LYISTWFCKFCANFVFEANLNSTRVLSSAPFEMDYSIYNQPQEQINVDTTLNIYPNPSNGILNISGNTGLDEITSIKVYNNNGVEVYAKNNMMVLGDFSREITLDIPDGVYMLKVVSSGNKTSTYKLVIVK